jgi:hypothetical protein
MRYLILLVCLALGGCDVDMAIQVDHAMRCDSPEAINLVKKISWDKRDNPLMAPMWGVIAFSAMAAGIAGHITDEDKKAMIKIRDSTHYAVSLIRIQSHNPLVCAANLHLDIGEMNYHVDGPIVYKLEMTTDNQLYATVIFGSE